MSAPAGVTSSRPHYASGGSSIHAVVMATFCTLLVVSNIAATKPIEFGPIIVDGGAFLFPLTYILGDILAEIYGLKRARLAILAGFGLAIVASLSFLLTGLAPPAPGYHNNAAFKAVLGFVPRIVAASLAGYLAGQLLNATVLVKIKKVTGERSMWARVIGSTFVGELADTVLFCVIAFAGVLSTPNLINYTVVGYVYKCLVEVVLFPVTYVVIRKIKKHEPSYRQR